VVLLLVEVNEVLLQIGLDYGHDKKEDQRVPYFVQFHELTYHFEFVFHDGHLVCFRNVTVFTFP
jgi:hypothetical protein